ncbi:Putative acyl-CoA synthetase YngI [Triticum urartu]|uniref:4-coumarate--CoA ligase n=1 Tax=Triticum urartu TaxID=4572 RepID=M7ZNC6_TRIUA|nr:Putative acyl-CoA synthetase YngI [Triticum urartu]
MTPYRECVVSYDGDDVLAEVRAAVLRARLGDSLREHPKEEKHGEEMGGSCGCASSNPTMRVHATDQGMAPMDRRLFMYPFASPPTGVVSLSFFSSLVGRDQEEEVEVLDMERGTVRCAANYAPLTPLSFIQRAAAVYGDRPAVVYAGRRPTTWREARDRCVRVAAALATRFGVARGDVVAVLSPNVPAMYELHFAVPMAGAVLCTLNTRHDAAMVSTLLKHSDAKVFLVESGLLGIGRDALQRLADSRSGAASIPVLVTISDDTDSIDPDACGNEYEALIKSAPSHFDIRWPANELDAITLNYTSGTTSRPKGVIYNHRGVYLNTIATALAYDITLMPMYLWTVPMFHGNGWSMTWAVAMQGGTNICLRHFTARVIFDNIARHGVTHMGGAPTERARLKARQGFHHIAMEDADVKDPTTMENVPHDGKTVGEVMFRGNTVTSGYYKDVDATKESMAGGWLRTGDLAIRHPEGYIQVKDRAKDIIISGGENISSIEVESIIFGHPAVLEAAVVARLDDHWGETPCAFVKLKDGASATEAEIIGFCREKLPHYMVPKTVVFEDLPKASTGKTQKFVLREKAGAMGSLTKAGNSKL